MNVGKEVKDAAIIVPVDFKDSYRHVFRGAESISVLNVLRIITAPTTEAIACGLE